MRNTRLLNCSVAFSLLSLFASQMFAHDARAADLVKGKALYENLCLSCHGATGLGDGPVGAALPPAMKPRNLQLGEMKYATDDVKFAELLKKGGAAVGLNALMPGQAQLSDGEIKDVIAFVHSLTKLKK